MKQKAKTTKKAVKKGAKKNAARPLAVRQVREGVRPWEGGESKPGPGKGTRHDRGDKPSVAGPGPVQRVPTHPLAVSPRAAVSRPTKGVRGSVQGAEGDVVFAILARQPKFAEVGLLAIRSTEDAAKARVDELGGPRQCAIIRAVIDGDFPWSIKDEYGC